MSDIVGVLIIGAGALGGAVAWTPGEPGMAAAFRGAP